MKYYFTSDFHLGHSRIIKYADRPFDNVEEMNQTIINNHNNIVSPEDTVFFLGDFCFSGYDYEDKLNGKFIFIKGNHDHGSSKKAIIDRMVINHGGKKILLIHDYNKVENKDNYDIILCGHIHEKWKVKDNFINVGVDVWDFKPHTINTILGAWYRGQN